MFGTEPRPPLQLGLGLVVCFLFTNDCQVTYDSNVLVKFADDTTVIGLIENNNEVAYREEIQNLTAWCDTNNLVLNIRKTKEIIVDFRTTKKITHTPLTIKDEAVERVHSYKFLGVTITEDFSWSDNIACIVSKAQQRLYFLRKLRKANLPQKLMVNFYRCTIESILTNCMTAWYGSCTKAAQKALQQVVKTAQVIVGMNLPSLDHLYKTRCLRRANKIIKDISHPNHSLFQLLPSGFFSNSNHSDEL